MHLLGLVERQTLAGLVVGTPLAIHKVSWSVVVPLEMD